MKLLSMSICALALILTGCKRPHHFYAQQSGGSTTTLDPQEMAAQADMEANTYALRIRDMNIDQLREARHVYQHQEEPILLTKVLERLIKLSPDHQERAACTAQLATMHLGMGAFEKARNLYQQFLHEYPGSPLRKQVLFRLIMAYHWDRALPEKDQDITYQTMQLCDSFAAQYGTLPAQATPEETTQHENVMNGIQNVKRSCLYDLALGDLERLDFYAIKYTVTNERSALIAAHDRLKLLLQTNGALLQSLGVNLEDAQEAAQDHDFLKRQDGASDDDIDDSQYTQYDDPLGTALDARLHLAHQMIRIAQDIQKTMLQAREKDGDAIINQLW